MRKDKNKPNTCNKVTAFMNAFFQGLSTGLQIYDNFSSSTLSIGLGFLALAIRGKTNWSFQGASIMNAENEEASADEQKTVLPTTINESLSQALIPAENHINTVENLNPAPSAEYVITSEIILINDQPSEEKTTCTIVPPVFTLIDGALNFSDHLFTWRLLSLYYLGVNDWRFWALMTTSFGMQQSFYMTQELWESLESCSPNQAPFYQCFCNPISGGKERNKNSRKAFRVLGSLHHTAFEFSPFFTISPQIVRFLASSWYTGIPSLVGLLILGYLIYETTHFFEGQHMEEHLAKNEADREKITIPKWRGDPKVERYLGMVVALFHGALIAAPTYIITNKILPYAGMPLGLFSLTAGTVGSWKSEVREYRELMDRKLKPAFSSHN